MWWSSKGVHGINLKMLCGVKTLISHPSASFLTHPPPLVTYDPQFWQVLFPKDTYSSKKMKYWIQFYSVSQNKGSPKKKILKIFCYLLRKNCYRTLKFTKFTIVDVKIIQIQLLIFELCIFLQSHCESPNVVNPIWIPTSMCITLESFKIETCYSNGHRIWLL